MPWQPIYHDRRQLRLNERLDIAYELLGHVVARLIDPLPRHLFLHICHLMDVVDIGHTDIRVVRDAL